MIASGIRCHLQIQEVLSLCTTLIQYCILKVGKSNHRVRSRTDFLASRRHRTSIYNQSYNILSSSLSVAPLHPPTCAMLLFNCFESCFSFTHRTPVSPAISNPFAQYMVGRFRHQIERSSACFAYLKFTRSYRVPLFSPLGRIPGVLTPPMYWKRC